MSMIFGVRLSLASVILTRVGGLRDRLDEPDPLPFRRTRGDPDGFHARICTFASCDFRVWH